VRSVCTYLRDAEQLPHLLAGLNPFRMRLGDFAGALAAAERYSIAAERYGGTGTKRWPSRCLAVATVSLEIKRRHSYESGFERWTLQDQLYNGKTNAVDHVADRMNFIATGIVELAKPRGNLDIDIVAKAAGRIQAAARHIGVAGGEILDSR
jgi:hypothetical protein